MDPDQRDDVLRQARAALGSTLISLASPEEAPVLAAQCYTMGFVAMLAASGGTKEAGQLLDVVNHELRHHGVQVVRVRQRPQAWREGYR